MHEFKYKDNELYCESVALRELAERYGTPLYVYSRKTIIDHYRRLHDAFITINPLICYSMKANSNLQICRILIKEGTGLDIVSGGELDRAVKTGVSSNKIVYAGVGKTEREMEMALKNKILIFNVESLPELALLDKVSGRLGMRQLVAIRINPNVKPKTHNYTTTGHEENKFGVDINTARGIFLNRDGFPNLDICGVHIHIGSQIVESAPFLNAIKKMLDFIKGLEASGIKIRWFNIGGGLGIIYSGEMPQTADEYAREVLPLLKTVEARIILEPGRFIVGNAGVLLTRVLYVKETPKKRFAIVDAGMNDLIRPSLYKAYHEALPVESLSERAPGGEEIAEYDIVGPICESGDFLAKKRRFISLKAGDLITIMGTGAYGFSMASNYNSRPMPAEVLVTVNRHKLIRKRQTYEDLLRSEL